MRYLKDRPQPETSKAKSKPSRSSLTDLEMDALAEMGADGLIWRLANHKELPFSGINDVLRTPARALWQAEVFADAYDRLQRIDQINAATAAALRNAHGRR